MRRQLHTAACGLALGALLVFNLAAGDPADGAPLADASRPKLDLVATIPLSRHGTDVERFVTDDSGRFVMPLRARQTAPDVAPLIDLVTQETLARLPVYYHEVHYAPTRILTEPCRIVATEHQPDAITEPLRRNDPQSLRPTAVVTLDCATMRVTRRYERPDGRPVSATEAVSARCGLLIAGPPLSLGRDANEDETTFTVFNLKTGKMNETLSALFESYDGFPVFTREAGCVLLLKRYGEPVIELDLRGAVVGVQTGSPAGLWRLDLDTRAARIWAAFPGSPTLDSGLFALSSPRLSESGRYAGVRSRRHEVEYEPDGHLLLGDYDAVEVIDLSTGQVLAPALCGSPGRAVPDDAIAMIGDDYALLGGCNGITARRIAQGDTINLTPPDLEGKTVLALSAYTAERLLAVAIDGDPNEIRLYRMKPPGNASD